MRPLPSSPSILPAKQDGIDQKASIDHCCFLAFDHISGYVYHFHSFPWYSFCRSNSNAAHSRPIEKGVRCTRRNGNTRSTGESKSIKYKEVSHKFVLFCCIAVTVHRHNHRRRPLSSSTQKQQKMIYRQVSVGVLNTNRTISEPKDVGNAEGAKKTHAKIKTYNEFGSRSPCHSSFTLFDRWRRH